MLLLGVIVNIRKLINWFFSQNFDRYKMSDYDARNVARMIMNVYNNTYTESHLENRVGDKYELAVASINEEDYFEHRCLEPVVEIASLLKKEKAVEHALVHGSLQDMSYVPGWSDLDTLVVVSEDIFRDEDRIIELKKEISKVNNLMLQVDSISHHGLIMLLESDLFNYDESIMPLPVLERAQSLVGSDVVSIWKPAISNNKASNFSDMRALFENFSKTGVFAHHPYFGEYLTMHGLKNNTGMYQLKYMISLVLSMPHLYFSKLGRPVYKADSFKLFAELFDGYNNIIHIFSDIRRLWGSRENYPYIPNKIPGWIVDMIPEDFIDQIILLTIVVDEDLSAEKKDTESVILDEKE